LCESILGLHCQLSQGARRQSTDSGKTSCCCLCSKASICDRRVLCSSSVCTAVAMSSATRNRKEPHSERKLSTREPCISRPWTLARKSCATFSRSAARDAGASNIAALAERRPQRPSNSRTRMTSSSSSTEGAPAGASELTLPLVECTGVLSSPGSGGKPTGRGGNRERVGEADVEVARASETTGSEGIGITLTPHSVVAALGNGDGSAVAFERSRGGGCSFGRLPCCGVGVCRAACSKLGAEARWCALPLKADVSSMCLCTSARTPCMEIHALWSLSKSLVLG